MTYVVRSLCTSCGAVERPRLVGQRPPGRNAQKGETPVPKRRNYAFFFFNLGETAETRERGGGGSGGRERVQVFPSAMTPS